MYEAVLVRYIPFMSGLFISLPPSLSQSSLFLSPLSLTPNRLSMSLYLPPSLSLSLCQSLNIYIYISCWPSLSLSLIGPLSFPIVPILSTLTLSSPFLSPSISLFPSHCLYFSFFRYIPVSQSFYISLSPSISLSPFSLISPITVHPNPDKAVNNTTIQCAYIFSHIVYTSTNQYTINV